jgi:hypothetical protein
MTEERRGKDERGRFLPGNTYAPGPMKPDEERIPHPAYPDRDTKGRALPGRTLPDYRKLRGLPPKVLFDELNARLHDCVGDTDMSRVYDRLFELTQQTDDRDIQIKAIKTFLDRFLGQPLARVHSNVVSHEMKVEVDLTALSNEELSDYLRLQTKVQSKLNTMPEADIIIDETPPMIEAAAKGDIAE